MRKEFNEAAVNAVKDRPATLTLRLSPEERARLEQDAAGMSLSAYARERMFGADVKPRRTRGKFPIKDQEAMARVLGRLGRAEMAFTLNSLMVAVEEGRLYLDAEQSRLLRSINDDINAMRSDLITALGLSSLPRPKACGPKP